MWTALLSIHVTSGSLALRPAVWWLGIIAVAGSPLIARRAYLAAVRPLRKGDDYRIGHKTDVTNDRPLGGHAP